MWGKVRIFENLGWKRWLVFIKTMASSYKARQTTEYLKKYHCPYTPDLSLNNFFLFPTIKEKMRVQRFSSSHEIAEDFQNHACTISSSEWRKYFQANISKSNKTNVFVSFSVFIQTWMITVYTYCKKSIKRQIANYSWWIKNTSNINNFVIQQKNEQEVFSWEWTLHIFH